MKGFRLLMFSLSRIPFRKKPGPDRTKKTRILGWIRKKKFYTLVSRPPSFFVCFFVKKIFFFFNALAFTPLLVAWQLVENLFLKLPLPYCKLCRPGWWPRWSSYSARYPAIFF